MRGERVPANEHEFNVPCPLQSAMEPGTGLTPHRTINTVPVSGAIVSVPAV